MWKVGIDTGGTFTDIVATNGAEMRTAKVSSTPPEFERGVLASIDVVDLDLGEVDLIAHGTTVSTNATITKSGARTALLTTRGSVTYWSCVGTTAATSTTCCGTRLRRSCRASCVERSPNALTTAVPS